MKKRVLQILISVCLVSIICYNAFNSFVPEYSLPASSGSNISRLEALQSYSVSEIEKEIDRLVSERLQAEEEKRLEEERLASYMNFMEQLKEGKITYRRLFSDTMIVGDSLMHGLTLYDILDSSNMITMVSASLYHLDDNVYNIINNSPEKLVLHYGINMLVNSEEGRNSFISMYRRIIKELKSELPDTEIYISSIFNVSDAVSASYPGVDKYNEALKALCDELEIGYVDNSYLLGGNSKYYGSDGIHVSKDFYYDEWLPHLYYSIVK